MVPPESSGGARTLNQVGVTRPNKKIRQGSDRRVSSDPLGGDEQDSRYSWLRLSAALVLGTIGTVGMWSYVVTLPAVQAEFALTRADATIPYTLAMIGFGSGSMLMGWLSDRFGVLVPVVCGAILLVIGYTAATYSNLWLLSLSYGMIGLGSSAAFVPLMADISQWFTRRRGVAASCCRSLCLCCGGGCRIRQAWFVQQLRRRRARSASHRTC
jgi:cyanate permease